MVATILIASADAGTRLGLAEQLSQMGWTCVEAQSPEECKQIVADGSAHAAVVDAETLAPASVTPLPTVTLVPGAATPPDIAKPVKLQTLLARLAQALAATGDEVEVTASWRMLPSERMLMHQGSAQRIALTDKERDLLLYLREAGTAGVAREELLARVWGYAEGAATHTVETHIHRLRSKIRDAKIDDELIETTELGYTLAS